MNLIFWIVPVLGLLAVLYALRPQTRISADQIWALTAAMPLLVALSVAGYSHVQASAALAAVPSAQQHTFVTVQNGLQVVGLDLSPEEAACFERTVRTSRRAEWRTEGGPVPLNAHTTIQGKLPPPEVARSMAIQGRLECRQWVRVLPDEPVSSQTAAAP
ncbi:hypothetical protein [Deinococcus sp. Marseille-Q6407]|uniref:hypothetical protein n=1 Tax=Deinococcus sp. Marseille-Q6407 TaxID=2969223 RepID=UPI0021BF0A36|nr:hypothetical protein [Deinococcus sp. Marseille-Q6407]